MLVKFRSSPSFVLGVDRAQTQAIDTRHIVAVQEFVKDSSRSVIILDLASELKGPLTVVVDGPVDWVLEQLGQPIKDATGAPAVADDRPKTVVLPERSGGRSSARPLEALPS